MRTLRLIFLLLFVVTLIEAQTVYVTKTGSKYHRSGCRYLSRSQIPISLEDAIRKYGACSVCGPPTSVKATTPAETPASTTVSTNELIGNNTKTSSSLSESASTSLAASKSRVAYITSIVDGTDIFEINIWDHRTERTTVVTSCRNHEKVTVLEEDEEYVKLRTEDGKEGWFLQSKMFHLVPSKTCKFL